jgi:hypothetical protein
MEAAASLIRVVAGRAAVGTQSVLSGGSGSVGTEWRGVCLCSPAPPHWPEDARYRLCSQVGAVQGTTPRRARVSGFWPFSTDAAGYGGVCTRRMSAVALSTPAWKVGPSPTAASV